MRPTSSRRAFATLALSLVTAAAAGACGSDPTNAVPTVTCGPGTALSGAVCVLAGSVDGGPDGSTTPPSPTVPTFNGATSAAPASDTSLQVTWAPANDTTTSTARLRYNVYVATTKGGQNFGAPTATTPPGATSYVVNGLTTNTEYFVVVRAVNEAKLEDKNANEKSGKPQADANAPAFGGATKAEPAAGGSVTVSWDAAQDDLTPKEGITYLVYVADATGAQNFAIPVAFSEPGAASVTVKGLAKPNSNYFFVVRARDAAGNVDKNKTELQGKSGGDTEAPLFAGCGSATVKDASSVTVAWTPAVDDTTPAAKIAYDVFASKTSGGQDFTNPSGTFTGTSLGIVTGLKQSTTYYFVCRARDVSNNADANTSERSATTLSDSTPPTFAGLSGTSNITATKLDLVWAAATDDQTAQAEIVYDVYEATAAGTESFATPKATSKPGATSITLTGLTPATTLYWIVRARDVAGNRDSNIVEKNAATGVSFDRNIQPILTQRCAVQGCHIGSNPPNGLNLSPGLTQFYIFLDSFEVATLKRVVKGNPSPTNSTNSYLYKKITGTHSSGEIMPPPSTNDSVPAGERALFQRWINDGASLTDQ